MIKIIFLLLIFLFIALLFYAWVLARRIRFAQMQLLHRLKDVIAAVHRRVDEFDAVLTTVMHAMPDEAEVWREFSEAKRTLLQALSGHDVNQIATADAELDRAEYDMKERVRAHPELKDNTEVQRQLDDMGSVDHLFEQHVKFYNETVDAFNDQIASFPTMVMTHFLKVRRASRFMIDQATISDHHLEAIVLE